MGTGLLGAGYYKSHYLYTRAYGVRTSGDKGRAGNYSLQRGENEGGHGAREHGTKEKWRQKGHGRNKGATGEASGTWENEGTDMATEVRITKGNGTKRKVYLISDQAS